MRITTNPALVLMGLQIIAVANYQRWLRFFAQAALGEVRVWPQPFAHPSKVPKLESI